MWDHRSAVWFRGGQGNGNAVSRRRCQLHGNYYKSYVFVSFPVEMGVLSIRPFFCLWIWKTDGHFSLAGQGQGPRRLRPLGFVFDRIVSTVASQVQTKEQIDVRVHSTRVSTCTTIQITWFASLILVLLKLSALSKLAH